MRTDRFKMAQVPEEIDGLVSVLAANGVRSYLEIGSQYGGSLWRVATSLPPGSRVTSVDLPHGDGHTMISLLECCGALRGRGFDVRVVEGDSGDPTVIEQARARGPYDAVFIDANHTLPCVTRDWQNYGPMGRVVALHDIAWRRTTRPGRLPIEVSLLWDTIRASPGAVTKEIVAEGSEKGIGVVWR